LAAAARAAAMAASGREKVLAFGRLAELSARTGNRDAAAAHLIRTSRSAAVLLDQLRDRLECRVHGACIGAGIELPAFACRVVATADALFQLPEVAMGLIPGAGGTVSVLRRIGRLRTAYLALSNRPIDAPTARAWGLVDEIAAG
ncbi:MAG: enoyl-CoA hydratase/isomerase family protein, partial [Pseudomonadales bacterium]